MTAGEPIVLKNKNDREWGKVLQRSQNEDGSDNIKETIEANYHKVKQEILSLVDSEIERIKNEPLLSHLIKD